MHSTIRTDSHRRSTRRKALSGLLALFAVAAWPLLSARSRPALAEAATNSAAPGQLTILDKKGQAAGLCPLKHTDVQADIAGYVARVTVQQEFTNPTKEAIEAVYSFPMPSDAAVDDMTMTIGSRVVKGQIKRKEEARAIYEAAKSAGQATALLDQERPNIFTQSVANIMPGDKVVITIRYVNLLKYQEGQYEFVFPMVVGPRYVPGGGYTMPGQRGLPSPTAANAAPNTNVQVGAATQAPATQAVVTDAAKITPPITPPGTRAGHDISVTVRLDAGIPLQQVGSALHKVNTQKQGTNRCVVRLQDQQEIPNKDFILRYSAAGSDIQEGILCSADKGSGYFTMILQPPAAPPQNQVTPKEMVFVIDQTGSQQGWPIEKAKETMRYCIQNLNPNDTFQLLGFNTEVYPCFQSPVPATPQNIQKALDYLKPLAGAGGTDILKAADYALKIPDDPDRLRIICYMTDGYVGNDMQIIHHIQENRGRARMFPFGCGDSVNRFLIDGMAREGRGAAEFVTLQSDGKEAAARFYRRVASPLLRDITVEWNGLPVADVFPRQIPDVFSAEPIILKGRYTRAAEGDITIHGLARGKPWQRTIHVKLPGNPSDASYTASLPTLWAREKIDDLQSQDWLGAQSGQPKPDIQQQIIATALEYRLMSQYTSFVAVEERVVNVGGKQRTLDVPVEMPEGVSYEGIFGTEGKADRFQRGAVMNQFYSRSLGSASMGRAASGGGPGGGGFVAGKLALPALKAKVETLAEQQVALDFDMTALADGTEAAGKRLAAMKPEERHATLVQVKLAPALQEKREKARKALAATPSKPDALAETVEVQIWLNSLPADGLKKLKAAGFTLSATLTPNRLLLGTVSLKDLDTLVELGFVRRIETPRFK